MMRALYTAASGMAAQQTNLDTISNNLANVDTTGFRKNLAQFEDQIYQTLQAPGSPVGTSIVPVGQQIGLGVKLNATTKEFTQGSIATTDNPLNMALEGDGFFQVTQPDGTIAYTRDGSFTRDANGSVVTSDGYLISPPITVPQNAVSVNVGQDGTVSVQLPGSQTTQQIGQVSLARFSNAAGLSPEGKNLFTQTAASGAPIITTPGINGAATIAGGYLEHSNVSVVDEMVNMIVAQRAFEANSKAVTTSDQMLSTAVQIKQ